MDKASSNVFAATLIQNEAVVLLAEHADMVETQGGEGGSSSPWAQIDQTKLPAGCFLWVENPENKATWHLPYREGAGVLEAATGMWKQAGQVNLSALRAVSAAISGARSGEPMKLPAEIKSKIKKLLKRYKVGQHEESRGAEVTKKRVEMAEQLGTAMLASAQLDKENCILRNVAILGPTSSNCSYAGGKGRRFSDQARASTARLITGAKAYRDHQADDEKHAMGGVRKMEDLLGFYENGVHDEAKKRVYADLHYLRYPAVKEWVEALVEQMPDKIGISLHAYGTSSFNEADQMEDIVDIEEVMSADMVTEPGSTTNLFESARSPAPAEQEPTEDEEEIEMQIEDLTLAFIRENRPDLLEAHGKELSEKQKAQGDVEAMRKTIAEQTGKIAGLSGKLDEYQLAERVRGRESRIAELIAESKIEKEHVTEVFMAALRASKDDETVRALLEDRKATVQKLTAGVRGMGSAGGAPKAVEEARKEYEAAVR